MNEKVRAIEEKQLRADVPEFSIGDTVRVHVRIREGEKERTQAFEGTVLARHGRGPNETFTVRRVSSGIGVERVFPVSSPNVQKIVVTRRGKARRAKLYYLRKRTGKAAKTKAKDLR
jgi:large subunit ribosomal protein L19